MDSVIRDMYFESVDEDKINLSEEYEIARDICSEAYDKLVATLNEEQKKLFDLYYDAECNFSSEWGSTVFAKAFKLGIRLGMEIMQ
ncbi:MAG: hypothetical protein K2K80_05730 [Clostridia bacterium]|nr:hypothetical protein [Clostridia bacterium]